MKTHKVRPVLVESIESTLHLSHGKMIITSIESTGKSDLYKSIPQELILISLEDEKIEVGDEFYCSDRTNYAHLFTCSGHTDNTHLQVKSDNEYGYGDWAICYSKKVIARQSQIPTEYISKFIEQYNNGCIEDLEIEMEELYFHGSGYYKAEQLSPVAQEKYDFMKELKPKLTNGFVTIVEKELKYNFSFDEARLVIDQFICEECPSYSQKGNGGTYLHKFMKERNIKLSKETISYTEEEVKNMLGLFGKHIMTHSDLEFGEEFEEAAIWLKSIKKK